jgi:predicted SnoaL-like aldol condensation-catalyzing enzyme
MSAEENKKIFLRFIGELGKGNLDVVDEVCSPKFAFHSPNFPGWPGGLEGARTLAAAGPSMFSDAQTKIDDVFAADDKVVLRMTIRGTYIGEPKHGFPKPGERFAMGAVAIYRFVDGKIVDDWGIQISCPTDTPWG